MFAKYRHFLNFFWFLKKKNEYDLLNIEFIQLSMSTTNKSTPVYWWNYSLFAWFEQLDSSS